MEPEESIGAGGKRGQEKEQNVTKRHRGNISLQTKQMVGGGTHNSSRWILRREMGSIDNGSGKGGSSTMILMEHLGDTSNMVESLTHQLDSWSLISSRQGAPKSKNSRVQKNRAKESKRAVTKALLWRDVSSEANLEKF